MPQPSILSEQGLEPAYGSPITDPGAAQGRVLVSMTPELTFVMRDDPANPPSFEKFVHYTASGEAYIAILRQSIVEFVLSDAHGWEFDPDRAPIEFKREADRKYYNVFYLPPQKPRRNAVLHARPTGKPRTDPQTHPFNFNLLIRQANADGSPGRALPICIDPEVKNPPPADGLLADGPEATSAGQ